MFAWLILEIWFRGKMDNVWSCFNSIQINMIHKMPEGRYFFLDALQTHHLFLLLFLIYIHLKQRALAACKTCRTWKACLCSPADMRSRYSRAACLPLVSSNALVWPPIWHSQPKNTRNPWTQHDAGMLTKLLTKEEAEADPTVPPLVTDWTFYWLNEKFVSSRRLFAFS